MLDKQATPIRKVDTTSPFPSQNPHVEDQKADKSNLNADNEEENKAEE